MQQRDVIPLTCPSGFIYSADCTCRHCTGRCLCEPSRFKVVNVTRIGTSESADSVDPQNAGSKPEPQRRFGYWRPADDQKL